MAAWAGTAALLVVALGGCSEPNDNAGQLTSSPSPTLGGVPVIPPGEETVNTARSITVRIELDPALTSNTAPDDTVFVFARAAQGPRMPLAAVRRQVKDLPLTVTLDDTMAMTPEMTLAHFPQVIVAARISKSGQVTPKPGDLEGISPPVIVGADGVISLTISKLISSQPSELPERHPPVGQMEGTPHPKGGVPLQLNIPAEVTAKWTAVELSVTEKTRAARTLRVPVGGRTTIGKNGLSLHVVAYVPAFRLDAGMVTSFSNIPENPAVLVRLLKGETLMVEGWVFQNFPDFNTFSTEEITVILVSGLTTA